MPIKGTMSKVDLTIELQFTSLNSAKRLSEKEKDKLEEALERSIRDIMEERTSRLRVLTTSGVKFDNIRVRALMQSVAYPIAATAIVAIVVETRSPEDNDGLRVNDIANEIVESSNDGRLNTKVRRERGRSGASRALN